MCRWPGSSPTNEWTGSLGTFADRITKDELQPGDILLFHNAADPQKGSHVVIFGGWTDATRTAYTAYEQTPPHTRKLATPYAYWSNSAKYLPYRYKAVTTTTAGGAPAATAYPGRPPSAPAPTTRTSPSWAGCSSPAAPGASTPRGPAPRWSDADRRGHPGVPAGPGLAGRGRRRAARPGHLAAAEDRQGKGHRGPGGRPRLARGGRLPRTGDVRAGRGQPVRHQARQAAGEGRVSASTTRPGRARAGARRTGGASRPSSAPRAGAVARRTATRARRPGGGSSPDRPPSGDHPFMTHLARRLEHA